MSPWQRSHACESMKKRDLIVWPSGVRIELGKNGPALPRPSDVIAAGGIVGFDDPVGVAPPDHARVPRAGADAANRQQNGCVAHRGAGRAAGQRAAASQPRREEHHDAQRRDADVRVDERPERQCRARLQQRQAERGADRREQPAQASIARLAAEQPHQTWQQEQGQPRAQHDVRDDRDGVAGGRRRKPIEIDAAQSEDNCQRGPQPLREGC